MDLSDLSGVAEAWVTGTGVQQVSAAGELLFEWSPFDHFVITDLAAAEGTGPLVNWTHGNALDLDTDGNLLVSFRSLSEITKIDSHSGRVLSRMGGLANQFTFEDTPVPALPASTACARRRRELCCCSTTWATRPRAAPNGMSTTSRHAPLDW